jgi:hypothetical protein
MDLRDSMGPYLMLGLLVAWKVFDYLYVPSFPSPCILTLEKCSDVDYSGCGSRLYHSSPTHLWHTSAIRR